MDTGCIAAFPACVILKSISVLPELHAGQFGVISTESNFAFGSRDLTTARKDWEKDFVSVVFEVTVGKTLALDRGLMPEFVQISRPDERHTMESTVQCRLRDLQEESQNLPGVFLRENYHTIRRRTHLETVRAESFCQEIARAY